MENPYAAPQTENPTKETFSNAEVVRRELISNENSIKTIGVLYILGGILLAAGMVGTVANSREGGEAIVPLVILLAISAFYLATGIGLRKLKRGARIPAVLISALGLLAFPLGTVIAVYFLYLLCNRKAGRILDPAYKEIIAQTPHVKQKTSIWLWILLLVLLGLIGLGVFIGLTTG